MDGRFDYQQYKLLSEEEKELFMFSRLCRIDDILDALEDGKKNFASKWVEHAMTTVIALVASGLIGLGFNALGSHVAQAAHIATIPK